MPPKQTIILQSPVSGGVRDVTAAMWYAIAPGKRIPRDTRTSLWPLATPAEIVDIQTGATLEEVHRQQYPSTTTIAAIRTSLQSAWTARQAELTADPPGEYYGAYWDGTQWRAAGS